MRSSGRCTCYPGVTVWFTALSAPAAHLDAAAGLLAERLGADGRRVAILRERPPDDLHRVAVTAEVLARNGMVAIAVAGGSNETAMARHRASSTALVEIPVEPGRSPEQSARAAHTLLAARGLA
ncbi:hypothetical protein [Streptomyces sp. NPDC050759]|uniref:hypothetical protein n=1 Tax=Streptomyces sp. NPDC050759 TaxID=3365635 RepID=UPI00379EFC36